MPSRFAEDRDPGANAVPVPIGRLGTGKLDNLVYILTRNFLQCFVSVFYVPRWRMALKSGGLRLGEPFHHGGMRGPVLAVSHDSNHADTIITAAYGLEYKSDQIS